jgi:hypothetical protein
LCPWNTRRELYQKVGNFVGSVSSPILANIYLHELDEFMEETTKGFNKGIGRAGNPKFHYRTLFPCGHLSLNQLNIWT